MDDDLKKQFVAIKKLIDDRQYSKALTKLKGIDHPTAREWEQKLEARRSPPAKRKARASKSNRGRNIVIGLIVLGVIGAAMQQSPNNRRQGNTAATSVPRNNVVATQPVRREATATTQPVNATPVRPTDVLVDDMPTMSLWATTDVRVRSCPSTDCDSLGTVGSGAEVRADGVTDGEDLNGNTSWYRILFNGQIGYIFSGLVSFTNTRSVQQPSQPLQPVQQAVVCPANCDEAVAMGLTAQEAAACGLDRDRDGVACYGD